MYIPGYSPQPFPLARHLPPLAAGVVAAYAEQFTAPGDIVIDPFGQSPRVPLELARLGRKVIVATHNPVLRLVTAATLDPIPPATRRHVLTLLADARMTNERVESYVRHIYRSTCADCGHDVEVDAFGWEHETLAEKSYHCDHCHAELTRPVDPADLELATRIPARGPHYHWALDRIAPAADPDRSLFAEVLAAYTPRALSVLFTLTLKSAALRLDAVERRALELLLLLAFDAGLSLDGVRPRTLKPHTRFREPNIWLALERLAREGVSHAASGAAIQLLSLEQIESTSGVVIQAGSIRDLAQSLPPRSATCLMSALPRPNLVLWTLSTAWTGWLWGPALAAPLGQLIRRRRYDWAWHENALRSSFSAAQPLLSPGGHLVALLPEAETGFVAAALTAAAGANYTLIQHSLRNDPPEAQFVFQSEAAPHDPPEDLANLICTRAEDVAHRVLHERGEPSRWNSLSGAIYVTLAHEHVLRRAVAEMVNDPLNFLDDNIEAACLNSDRLIDLRAAELDSVRVAYGLWWLAAPEGAATPLVDRAEREVARALAATRRTGIDWVAVEQRVCDALPGLTLPGGNLIRRCLDSYGEERDGLWFFRPEDNPLDRAAGFEQLRTDLAQLGGRLNFEIRSQRSDELEWHDPRKDVLAYHFFITATAEIGGYILRSHESAGSPQTVKRILLIPGGRAELVDYKVKRDPRLRTALDMGGWLIVKYRHIRRLANEPALTPADLLASLARDPITQEKSTQMTLL